MSETSITTQKEFIISKEIVATEGASTEGEIHLINEQSNADIELVDFEVWLSSYLPGLEIVYDYGLENYTLMGAPDFSECQDFFDSIRGIVLETKS